MMIVNLISPDGRYDSTFLSNYATIYIKDELGRLPGVAGITYLGQRDYSLRAWLDPDKLAALNLSAMDVVTAISQQNVQVAAGQIGQQPVPRGQQFQLTINTLGRLVEPEQFGDIIFKAGGQNAPAMPISAAGRRRAASRRAARQTSFQGGATDQGRLEQPGRPDAAGHRHRPAARRGPRRAGVAAVRPVLHPGRQAIRGGLDLPVPGSNALDTAAGVYAKMKELKTRFPDGLDYKIVYDTTPFIRESVNEVFKTLRDAVILVGIVVLVFLQDWKAMILPMIDVPVSLIGTFAVMAAMGFIAEQPDAVRPGAGHRHRGGRRHRGAGEHRAADRDRTGLAHGHDQGDGGDHRADPGDHAGAQLGVHSLLLPRGDHGPVLPPVRGDDRRVDDHLGHQRPDHDAVAGRDDLQDRGRATTVTQLKREALPWWIFGIVGGVLSVWLGRASSGRPTGSACRRQRARPTRTRSRAGCTGSIMAAYFAPGAVGRRRVGLDHHQAGERRAGLVVPRVQPRSSTG